VIRPESKVVCVRDDWEYDITIPNDTSHPVSGQVYIIDGIISMATKHTHYFSGDCLSGYILNKTIVKEMGEAYFLVGFKDYYCSTYFCELEDNEIAVDVALDANP